PDEQLRLAEMLSRARDHARNGDLFGEPGQNAIDAYNNALRIDPKNAEAIAGMAALPARAKDLFEQAMTGNRLNAAYEYFDALRELSANDAVIPGMRDRLVRAYVDKAKALNAAGKTTDAKRAAIKARELAPDSPVTAELANLL
nr:hypothetical protein [Xanthomonadales bacterium]